MNVLRLLPALVPLLFAECALAQEPTDVRVVKDVPYVEGGGKLQQLDVYSPADDAKHPVLVYVHGGGWQKGDKRSGATKGQFFASQHGWVFVSVNYRLTPAVQHPEHARDVVSALSWIRAKIADHGGDPERVYFIGHSAGAHLAALVPLHSKLLAEREIPTTGAVRGVILLDGAGYSIQRRIESGAERARKMFEAAFGTDPEGWRDASPIAHAVDASAPPPYLILHVATRVASGLQAKGLKRALQMGGGRAWLLGIPNKTHATINRAIGQPGDLPTELILEFLSACEDGREPQILEKQPRSKKRKKR